jgi:hypothetical protein
VRRHNFASGNRQGVPSPRVILLQLSRISLPIMRFRNQESAELFQEQVAQLLELPEGSGDAQVRTALRSKGPDFVVWYDTRLRAIAESIGESAL